jgi:hypothetical protein
MAFNINKFTKDSTEYKDHSLVEQPMVTVVKETVDEPKKKRRKKNEVATQASAPIPIPTTSMSYIQENIPYASAYAETNKQLDDSIAQLNALGAEIVTELNIVRGNKTMRNKYGIINDMTQTATSILNTKLSAIKEKNATINNINKLELDRLKQIKVSASEEDDNTRIANLYDAFVNTPIGAGPGILAPPMQDIMAGGINGPSVPMMSLGSDQQAWESSLSPAENRMVLEAKGAIETIVMYDSNTGNRWFEVVDRITRQPIPNVEKPDNSYIYDLDINIRGGFAKDSNRNISYPLVVVNGQDTSIIEY